MAILEGNCVLPFEKKKEERMKRAFHGIVLVLVTAGMALAGSARAADPAEKASDAQKLVVASRQDFR